MFRRPDCGRHGREPRSIGYVYTPPECYAHAPSTVAFARQPFIAKVFRFRFVAETKFYIPLQHKFTKLQNLETLCHNSTGFRSIYTADELRERLRRIRHVALDMDGTIYMGMSLFSCTKALSVGIEGAGHQLFVPHEQPLEIDRRLPAQALEAGHRSHARGDVHHGAGHDRLHQDQPAAGTPSLFLLGTPSMISEFEKAGFVSTGDDPDDVPDAIVAAFDMTLSYDRLCRAAWWISQGVPLHSHQPRPRMSHRPARRTGRLRLDMQMSRTRHGTPPPT